MIEFQKKQIEESEARRRAEKKNSTTKNQVSGSPFI